MPPSRDPVWDYFYSLKSDFREDAIGLFLQARKNASYDNAWCKHCVDHLLGQVEYSHWVPGGQCTLEYLDLLRRYRVMKVVAPIRGQPKNLERHMRSCKLVPEALRPKPIERIPREVKPKTDASVPANINALAPAAGFPSTLAEAGPSTAVNPLASASTLPMFAPPPLNAGMALDPALASASGPPPQTPPRLSRGKQAELDADIYNLFTGLGIPFDDRTCMIYGQFVRKWIPGAKWGED